jgi:hypothetical protein
MSNTGARVKFEAVREMAAASITTSYQLLGTALTRNYFTLVLTNTTNGDIYVSFDNSTDQMLVPASTGRVFDYKTNDMYLGPESIYIKWDSAPGAPTGLFAVEVQYV